MLTKRFSSVLAIAIALLILGFTNGHAHAQEPLTMDVIGATIEHDDEHTEEDLPEEATPTTVEEPAAEEDFDELVEGLEDAFTFDGEEFTVALNDLEYALVQMAAILDRYEGGYPAECDNYLGYVVYILGLPGAAFVPAEWQFIVASYELAIDEILRTQEPLILLCINGGDGHLSDLNYGLARKGVEDALNIIRPKIAEAVNLLGGNPGSLLEFIELLPPPTDALLEELARELGVEFSAIELYNFMLLSELLFNEMGGWLDRLNAGDSVACDEFLVLYFIVNSAPGYFYVPPEWRGVYGRYVNSVQRVLDTSFDVLAVCAEGGTLSAHNYGKARQGIADSLAEIQPGLREAEERLGVISVLE